MTRSSPGPGQCWHVASILFSLLREMICHRLKRAPLTRSLVSLITLWDSGVPVPCPSRLTSSGWQFSVTLHFPCVGAVSRLSPERAHPDCVLGRELTGVSSLTHRLKRCPRQPVFFQFLVVFEFCGINPFGIGHADLSEGARALSRRFFCYLLLALQGNPRARGRAPRGGMWDLGRDEPQAASGSYPVFRLHPEQNI